MCDAMIGIPDVVLKEIFPYLENPESIFTDMQKLVNFRNKIFHFSDILTTNYNKVDILLQKYTKGIYNSKEFLI